MAKYSRSIKTDRSSYCASRAEGSENAASFIRSCLAFLMNKNGLVQRTRFLANLSRSIREVATFSFAQPSRCAVSCEEEEVVEVRQVVHAAAEASPICGAAGALRTPGVFPQPLH